MVGAVRASSVRLDASPEGPGPLAPGAVAPDAAPAYRTAAGRAAYAARPPVRGGDAGPVTPSTEACSRRPTPPRSVGRERGLGRGGADGPAAPVAARACRFEARAAGPGLSAELRADRLRRWPRPATERRARRPSCADPCAEDGRRRSGSRWPRPTDDGSPTPAPETELPPSRAAGDDDHADVVDAGRPPNSSTRCGSPTRTRCRPGRCRRTARRSWRTPTPADAAALPGRRPPSPRPARRCPTTR